MKVKKNEVPILVANLVYIVGFGGLAMARGNYEFVCYGVVLVSAFSAVLFWQERLAFSRPVLWGLTLWGLMHMAGGNVYPGGTRLYDVMVVPIVGGKYAILKYDQIVHTIGFGVVTVVCYHLLKPYLAARTGPRRMLPVLIVLMGLGVGALNEVVEFAVAATVQASGVGGYENTALDLVFNTLGAVLAVVWVSLRETPAVTQSA